MRREFRFAGQGGQGIILAAVLLAAAAVEYEGLNAVQTQAYGPESRGGASRAEVTISDEEIIYPEIDVPDVVLVMNQRACDAYAGGLKPGGILVINSSMIDRVPPVKARIYELPFTKIARERTGTVITSNMVALGAVAAITGIVSREAIPFVMESRISSSHRGENMCAFDAGYDAGCALVLARTGIPAHLGEPATP